MWCTCIWLEKEYNLRFPIQMIFFWKSRYYFRKHTLLISSCMHPSKCTTMLAGNGMRVHEFLIVGIPPRSYVCCFCGVGGTTGCDISIRKWRRKQTSTRLASQSSIPLPYYLFFTSPSRSFLLTHKPPSVECQEVMCIYVVLQCAPISVGICVRCSSSIWIVPQSLLKKIITLLRGENSGSTDVISVLRGTTNVPHSRFSSLTYLTMAGVAGWLATRWSRRDAYDDEV